MQVLRTQNLAEGRRVDPVSRWLLIVRASVFPMTLTSGLIGGLLAADVGVDWASFLLAVVGLLLAHAGNNMINDYFDFESGLDTEGYVRVLYAPHPVASGLITRAGLLAAIVAVNLADLAILLYLVQRRGPWVAAFAVAGLLISVFYVAPPIRLKHRGLGEPGVALVWGPLMIGGCYYVAAGETPAWVYLASIPYALLVTTVLFGKHIDKLESDSDRGIRTLPVLLGADRALAWARAMMAGFFVTVVILVASSVLPPWVMLVLFALPRLRETMKVFGAPAPAEPPAGYPIWPLWYVAWAFRLTRFAGSLFVLGLAINLLVPWSL